MTLFFTVVLVQPMLMEAALISVITMAILIDLQSFLHEKTNRFQTIIPISSLDYEVF